MTIEQNEEKPNRVIRTARDLESINRAVAEGFFPLIKELKPSPMLNVTYCVFRHRKTNQVVTAEAEEGYLQYGEYYSYKSEEWEIVIPYANYYPYTFPCPFAAYLIPPNIVIGERVIIEDLIEDYSGGVFWSQKIRLETLEAIWDGSDLAIQYDPNVHGVCNWVG